MVDGDVVARGRADRDDAGDTVEFAVGARQRNRRRVVSGAAGGGIGVVEGSRRRRSSVPFEPSVKSEAQPVHARRDTGVTQVACAQSDEAGKDGLTVQKLDDQAGHGVNTVKKTGASDLYHSVILYWRPEVTDRLAEAEVGTVRRACCRRRVVRDSRAAQRTRRSVRRSCASR